MSGWTQKVCAVLLGAAAVGLLLALPETILLLLSDAGATAAVSGGVLALAGSALVGQASGVLLLLLAWFLFRGGLPALSARTLAFLDWVAWGSATPSAGRRLVSAQISLLPAAALCVAGCFLSIKEVLERLHNENLMAAAILLLCAGLVVVSVVAAAVLFRGLEWLFAAVGFPAFDLPVIVLLLPVLLVLSVGLAVAGYKGISVGDLVNMSWLPQLAVVSCGAALGSMLLFPVMRRTNRIAGWVLSFLPVLLFLVLGNIDQPRLAVQVGGHLGKLTLGLAAGLSDVDGDGFGSLFGGPDCAPFDPAVNPSAREIAGNGIDENCNGADGDMGFAVNQEEALKYRERVRKLLPEQPNIILITWDAARASNFSSYGYARKTTPAVDRLAAKSAVFANAYAPGPNTHSSIPALLTGRNIFSVALRKAKKSRMMIIMEDENVTIAEMLKAHGYHTAAVVSHRFFDKKHNWHQGFDQYSIAVRSRRKTISSPRILKKAKKIIGKHAREGEGPLFLWTHFYDPHSSYVKHDGTPFKIKGSKSRDRYDSELWFTDKHTGKLLKAAAKLPGKTVFIISADHGDSLGEHGKAGQHRDLHRENLHVPLVVHVPGARPGVVNEPVSVTDILPTIADLGRAEVPEGVRGASLLPGILDGEMDGDRPIFSEVAWRFEKPPEHWVAAALGDYRFLREIHSGQKELYCVASDPLETENLADLGLVEAGELERALSGFLETTTVPTAETERIP